MNLNKNEKKKQEAFEYIHQKKKKNAFFTGDNMSHRRSTSCDVTCAFPPRPAAAELSAERHTLSCCC